LDSEQSLCVEMFLFNIECLTLRDEIDGMIKRHSFKGEKFIYKYDGGGDYKKGIICLFS